MNKELMKKVKKRWEGCPGTGSHLYPTGWHKSEENMMNRFKNFLEGIDVNNKTIIDYGCGGGYLGRFLLDNFKIKKYIAFDIAERSVNRAKEQLKNYKNKEIILIDNHDIKFIEYKSDIFCCFACIIHFPTENYLNVFLNNVNKCKSSYILLEIRDRNKGTIFRKKPYNNFRAGNRACLTNYEYISERLSNYLLYKKTDPTKHKTNCQILFYKKLNHKER